MRCGSELGEGDRCWSELGGEMRCGSELGGWWVGCSTLSLTSNESVESGRHHCCAHKNAHNLPVMRRRFDGE
ncbi:hypothetical protein E2C01_095900 [Portunus trituberculatus]|uniref:Uncharacterized protein n=1 Tax=Portunus trituberculatus TaxID=210409 RepID=A0A5B7K5H4_PORTR|nr:hypothetical protein [Portunus trituberculatus]